MTGVLPGQPVTISATGLLVSATTDGPFVLARNVPAGTAYTISASSGAPNQRCLVTSGSRGILNANVTSILVDCGFRQPWSLNGDPLAAALSEDGSRLFIAGTSTYVTTVTDLQFRLDNDTGRALAGSLTQSVFLGPSARPDGSGGAYLTEQVPPVEFFDPDSNYTVRRIDANGNPTSFRANGLRTRANARVGDRLFLAGTFPVSGTSPPAGLVAVDATTGARLSWSTDMRGEGVDLVATSNTLFVQRRLTDASGSGGFTLAAVDVASGATREWAPRFTGFSGIPISTDPMKMALSGRTLIVTGNFLAVDGVRRTSVAAFDTETLQLRAWPANPLTTDSTAQTEVAATSDRVFLNHGIDPPDGVARSVYAVSTETGELLAWAPPVLQTGIGGRPLYGMVVQGDRLLLHGDFAHVNGQPRRGLAALAVTDGRLLAFAGDSQLDRGPGGLFVSGANIWVWGGARGGGVPAAGIMALDTRTGAPAGISVPVRWSASATAGARLLRVGTTLILTGSFDEVGGQPRRNLAAIDAATGAVLPWNPDPDGVSMTVKRQGDRLYFVGDFTLWNGQPRPGVARVDARTLETDGFGTATGFIPQRFDRLAEAGERLYVGRGATFLAVDAATGTREFWLTALDSAGDFTNTVDLEVRGEFVYAAGQNYRIPGVTFNRNTVRLSTATGAPAAWLEVSSTPGIIEGLFRVDDTLLVASCSVSPLSVRTCNLGAETSSGSASSFSLLFSDVLPVADVLADASSWYLIGTFGASAAQPSGVRFLAR